MSEALSASVQPDDSKSGDNDFVDVERNSDASLGALRKRVLRLATFKRGYTFKQQQIRGRTSWSDHDDDIQVHKSTVSGCVKASYAAPQFSVLAAYMLLAIHATLLYEYAGAELQYISFFTATARSLDVFTDPIMSSITDSTRSRFGRRIPYILVGSYLYATSLIVLLGVGVLWPIASESSCVFDNTTDTFELDGDADITDPNRAIYYGAAFIGFYLTDTIANVPYNALGPELSDSSNERENVYLFQNLAGTMGTLIGAVAPPLLETAGLAKELAFFITGVFFGTYYLVTAHNLAYNVGERSEGFEGKAPTPLIPSTLRSFSNPGFRILLYSWFIDAIGWFSLAAVLPLYVVYYLQPRKAGVELITDEIFLGLALTCLFVSAMIGMPFWKLLARRIGRYRAWLAYNLWNGLSNALYILVGPQDWELALVITCLNGIPFGGKFLSDATLADCIEYAEFITGERTEAQFTMFASFVPKIVSIPSQALPLAIIGALGFVQSSLTCSEEGETEITPSEQPEAVKLAIQIIFVALPVISNLISFIVKTKYPFTKKSQIELVSAGIVLHSKGLPAEDPITGEIVKSPLDFTTFERNRGIDFDYFTASEKRKILTSGGSSSAVLVSLATTVVVYLIIAVSAAVGVYMTFDLLNDQALSWAPSFLQIVCGLSFMVTVFTFFRLKHAWNIRNDPFKKSFMQRWIEKTEGGARFDDSLNPLLRDPAKVLAALQEDSDSETDSDDDGDDDEEDDKTRVDEIRNRFRQQKQLADLPQPQGSYMGSTRNFVKIDEEEKNKILQTILSGKKLI